jgi:hypothetical protein
MYRLIVILYATSNNVMMASCSWWLGDNISYHIIQRRKILGKEFSAFLYIRPEKGPTSHRCFAVLPAVAQYFETEFKAHIVKIIFI